MAEVFMEFESTVRDESSREYVARACGRQCDDGHWEGWLEFVPLDGGVIVQSGRETTQPNRVDTEYWATGLTPVFLEGALRRALAQPILVPVAPARPSIFDEPARSVAAVAVPPSSVLNPFSV